MGGRARQIIFDVAIIAGGIVSLALLALAFLFDSSTVGATGSSCTVQAGRDSAVELIRQGVPEVVARAKAPSFRSGEGSSPPLRTGPIGCGIVRVSSSHVHIHGWS